jgi:hypothetical protein
MPVTVNPDATLIPDQAEVWVALKSTVTSISSMIPATPSDDLSALGWSFCGLIDDKKGIPLDPSIEVKEYDAFGHPQFRVKLKNGKLKTGFTALERNTVTKQIVCPGRRATRSAPRRTSRSMCCTSSWIRTSPTAPPCGSPSPPRPWS